VIEAILRWCLNKWTEDRQPPGSNYRRYQKKDAWLPESRKPESVWGESRATSRTAGNLSSTGPLLTGYRYGYLGRSRHNLCEGCGICYHPRGDQGVYPGLEGGPECRQQAGRRSRSSMDSDAARLGQSGSGGQGQQGDRILTFNAKGYAMNAVHARR
jgi:hypothetical protein